MKTKLFWTLLSWLLVGAIALVACVRTSTSDPTSVLPTEVPTEEPTEVPTEVSPTEIPDPTEEPIEPPNLVIWVDDVLAFSLEPLVEDFFNEHGVNLEIQQVSFGDIRERIKVVGPAGEGPDIFIGAHEWLGELVAYGLVAEVDLSDLADQFLPASLQAFTYEGVLYGMPYATDNVAFVYNPDIVAKAPETWDEVFTLSEAGPGYVIQSKNPYYFFPLMTSYGGYVFGVTQEGYDPSDLGIDSEGTIEAAKYLEDMVNAGLLAPGIDYEMLHTLFETGDASMIITGVQSLPRIRESNVRYVVTSIPAGDEGPGRPLLSVQGFMINAFSENKLIAQTLLNEFIASDVVMQALYDANSQPSAWLSVREAITDPDLAGFASAGSDGYPLPAIPEMSSVWIPWGFAIEQVINGTDTPESAFIWAAEQIRAEID